MFHLTASELDSAKAAIDHHGYSTLLPSPPEWDEIAENWHPIRDYLSSIDLEEYIPHQPLLVVVPKDEKSVRIVHLLHPEDMLLYTSLTLIVKDDLEGVRLPRTRQRVYSYRASRRTTVLYDSVGDTHGRYIEQLKRKAGRPRTNAVAVADIADFYASVPQAELKRLLKAAARTQKVAQAAELLISVFAARLMSREGHGIPTGPLASRLLAEVLLNEIDKYLLSKKIDFVRWVDDYNIFAPSLASARTMLFELATWLYNNGLTLQAAKTTVLDRGSYTKRFLVDIEDRFSDKTAILEELLQIHGYGGDDLDVDVKAVKDDLQAVELLEALVDAILGDDSVDFRVIAFVARKLLRMTLDPTVGREVLDVLTENVEQLSPVIATVAPLIEVLLPNGRMPKRVGRRLLRSLRGAGVDHQAVWILAVFAEKGREVFLDELTSVYEEAESHVVKRYAALAIRGSGGTVSIGRGEWTRSPPLVRLALLRAGVLRNGRSLEPRGMLEELVAMDSRTYTGRHRR